MTFHLEADDTGVVVFNDETLTFILLLRTYIKHKRSNDKLKPIFCVLDEHIIVVLHLSKVIKLKQVKN